MAAASRTSPDTHPLLVGCQTSVVGMRASMSNLSDDDMTTEPTEAGEDRDQGGQHERDTGDEPTESDENLDPGGEGPRDTGDES